MSCSNAEPPDDDNQGSVTIQNKVASLVDQVVFYVLLVPVLIGMLIRFVFWHRDITFKQARQIRAIILRDRVWPWWHIGFTPWFTINWMLMTFDEKKDSLSTRIKSGKRAIDAVSRVRHAMVKDEDVLLLRDVWNEFLIRDQKEFNGRDRRLFMLRVGSLFSKPAMILLENAILLRPSDYLVLKYLCCKTCRYLESRIRRVGIIESNVISYFIEHKMECCLLIQHFKPTILKMARFYVENMISFCLGNDLEPTAHIWAQAGKCIVHLQELDPTDENESLVREEIGKFFLYFEQASGPVYVRYQELDRRILEEKEKEVVETLFLPYHEPPPDNTPSQKPVDEKASKVHDEWTEFYDRDVLWFHISADGSTITDTTSLRKDGSYEYEYTGITENASVVRRGLAFFFGDFDKNCKAHQDDSGDWIVTQENDFTKMSVKDMKKFKTSLKAIPGMKNFIPDILCPKSTDTRTDGKVNNRSGKYRIDPCPACTSDYGATCQLDAIE